MASILPDWEAGADKLKGHFHTGSALFLFHNGGLIMIRIFVLLMLLLDSLGVLYGGIVGLITGTIPIVSIPFMVALGLTMPYLLYIAYMYGFEERFLEG